MKIKTLTGATVAIVPALSTFLIGQVLSVLFGKTKTDVATKDGKYLSGRYLTANKGSTQYLNIIVIVLILYFNEVSFGLGFIGMLLLLRSPFIIALIPQLLKVQAFFINDVCSSITKWMDLNVRIGTCMYWIGLVLGIQVLLCFHFNLIPLGVLKWFVWYNILQVFAFAPKATDFNNWKSKNN